MIRIKLDPTFALSGLKLRAQIFFVEDEDTLIGPSDVEAVKLKIVKPDGTVYPSGQALVVADTIHAAEPWEHDDIGYNGTIIIPAAARPTAGTYTAYVLVEPNEAENIGFAYEIPTQALTPFEE